MNAPSPKAIVTLPLALWFDPGLMRRTFGDPRPPFDGERFSRCLRTGQPLGDVDGVECRIDPREYSGRRTP